VVGSVAAQGAFGPSTPDTAAIHANAQQGLATSASPLMYAERIQQLGVLAPAVWFLR
jgi:hypothetical protein